MSVYMLCELLMFPDPNTAGDDGLLALGGDLSAPRVLLAYEMGIFPWFSDGQPYLWWSPDPRSVLYFDNLKISKSMRNILNRSEFKITFDQVFESVVRKCATTKRKEEEGTWINEEMIAAYTELHNLGTAHSVEVWKNGELCGGLYGVSLGKAFFGESMFAEESNASKVALIWLVDFLKKRDFHFIDCQVMNPHLESLGAQEVPRKEFLLELQEALNFESILGNWGNLTP